MVGIGGEIVVPLSPLGLLERDIIVLVQDNPVGTIIYLEYRVVVGNTFHTKYAEEV